MCFLCILGPSQHDLRVAHCCSGTEANVAVNLLNHLGRYAEAKCVAVNPRRSYMLAVGANDFYVRLYDTRMIKLAKLIVSMRLDMRFSHRASNSKDVINILYY